MANWQPLKDEWRRAVAPGGHLWTEDQTGLCYDPTGKYREWSHLDQQITVSRIITALSDVSELTPEQIKSHKRDKAMSHVRMIGYLLATELCPIKSLPEIGRVFNRDHTTIAYGAARAKGLIEANPALRQVYDRVKRELLR